MQHGCQLHEASSLPFEIDTNEERPTALDVGPVTRQVELDSRTDFGAPCFLTSAETLHRGQGPERAVWTVLDRSMEARRHCGGAPIRLATLRP